MLEDQVQRYSRYEFKRIMAHCIYFKQEWSDKIVDLFSEICLKQQMGYTFVEIVQFAKVNGIILSGKALQRIANVWYRFAIVNEDMLPFIREYCKKTGLTFETNFYR